MVLVEKIMALVRLATDAGASEQEQRTAAVAACKLIRENKLIVSPADAVADKFRRKQSARKRPPPPRKDIGDVILTSYFASKCGKCILCKRTYEPWAPLADIDGKPAHLTCAMLRAAS